MSQSNDKEFLCVPLSQLPVGTTLKEPIFDGRSSAGKDLLLLAAGQTLSQSVVDQLVKRGATEIRVSIKELRRIQQLGKPTANTAQRTAAVKRASQEELRDSEKFGVSKSSFVHNIQKHGVVGYHPERVAEAVEEFQKSTEQITHLLDRLCRGALTDSDEVASASEASLDRIAEDMDLAVGMGLCPADNSYSSKHSLQTSMVAMAIGTTLGLPRDQLVELGIGCLVHDAGMRYVPQELVQAPRQLNEIEFLEITKHPSITFELLQKMPDVPTGSRMVAYQMHERCNGTGYPRGRHSSQIHALARIAMVADVFVAMVSPRPYRAGILPYQVMEYMLHCTKRGEFDADVVRALLQTTSLFPIGSYVALNDGRTARVVRAHPTQFNAPIVETVPPEGSGEESVAINVAETPDLQIVQALPVPPRILTQSASPAAV